MTSSINTWKLCWATDRQVSFLVRVKKCHCMLSSFFISCLSSLSHPCTHSQTHFLWNCQASSVVFSCHCVCSLCACWALTSPSPPPPAAEPPEFNASRSNINTASGLLWSFCECSAAALWHEAVLRKQQVVRRVHRGDCLMTWQQLCRCVTTAASARRSARICWGRRTRMERTWSETARPSREPCACVFSE